MPIGLEYSVQPKPIQTEAFPDRRARLGISTIQLIYKVTTQGIDTNIQIIHQSIYPNLCLKSVIKLSVFLRLHIKVVDLV